MNTLELQNDLEKDIINMEKEIQRYKGEIDYLQGKIKEIKGGLYILQMINDGSLKVQLAEGDKNETEKK